MDKSKWVKIAPFFVLTGVVLLLWKALSLNPTELPLERMGEALPSFSLPNLKDETHILTEKDIPNKPMLIHIWATWCGVCRQEHPVLLKLQKKGVPIIGISYRDDTEHAISFLDKKGDPFITNIADLNGKFGLDLGVYGTPETYIVDSKGTLRYRHVGILDDKQDIQQIMATLKTLQEEDMG